MTKKETFLLVSLEEEKAKKLAQVISNESCRKILDFLAKKTSTESELSKELNVPISTVHYNLKHLVSSGLVEAKEYHYSEKGKEVNHYSLANKLVIIAPKKVSEGFMDKLKSLVPAVLIVGAIGFAINLIKGISYGSMAKQEMLAAPRMMVEEAAMDAVPAMAQTLSSEPSTLPVWLWYVLGSTLMIVVYLIIEHLRMKWKK